LCHVILDILVAQWGENDIFGFFGVRHVNRGRIEYCINRHNRKLSRHLVIWSGNHEYSILSRKNLWSYY